MEAAFNHLYSGSELSSPVPTSIDTSSTCSRTRQSSHAMSVHTTDDDDLFDSPFLKWEKTAPLSAPRPRRAPNNNKSLQTHMKRANQNRTKRDDHQHLDDVSEVTVDTILKDTARTMDLSWMAEQMAIFKLDLANAKADCDRAQWQHAQLLEKKQQGDRTIATLEKENKELKASLRDLEKKYLLLSMGQTSSMPAGNQHSHGDSEGQSVHSGVSATNFSGRPYRTIHEDGEEDDCVDENASINTGWRRKGGSLSQDHCMESTATPVVDMTQMKRGSSINSLTGGTMLEEFHDFQGINLMDDDEEEEVKMEQTQVTGSSTIYPDDDPFCTLNPDYESEDEDRKPSNWWGWKGKKPIQ